MRLPTIAVFVSVGAAALTPATSHCQDPDGAAPLVTSYLARFYCSDDEPRDLPGGADRRWDTEVALANQNVGEVALEIWATEARPIFGTPPLAHSESAVELDLAPGDAVRIGCSAIQKLLPTQHQMGSSRRAIPNGFIRINASAELDAVATYVYFVSCRGSDGAAGGASTQLVTLQPGMRADYTNE